MSDRGNHAAGWWHHAVAALAIAFAASTVVLLLSDVLRRILGTRVLLAIGYRRGEGQHVEGLSRVCEPATLEAYVIHASHVARWRWFSARI
jgi:hypothetical protein